MEKIQWDATKKTWDILMDNGLSKWQPGPMGTETFFIETPEELKKVKKGDWVVKSDDGNFNVQEQS